MSDAAAAARAALAARQRSWMQQRQAEQDRIQAETSIRRERIANPVPVAPQNASSTGAAAVAGMDTEVLDRLTMQIADRLQVEVRKESKIRYSTKAMQTMSDTLELTFGD